MYVIVTFQLILLMSFGDTNTFLDQIRKVDYCKPNLTCSNVKHTVCSRSHDCRGSSKCSPIQINAAWRKVILEKHNDLRNTFATNKEIGEMNILNYDLELEYIARCWANICSGISDKCRKTKKYQHVGQNEFRATTVSGVPEDHLTQDYLLYAITRWYDEYELIEDWAWWGINVDKRSKRFFQVVWPHTTHIGCARSKSDRVFMLYCNYAPGVDVQKGTIKFGDPPCSACPNDCNKEFTSLCGAIEPIPDELLSRSGRPKLSLIVTLILVFNTYLYV